MLVLVLMLLLLKQFRRQWRKHADAELRDIAVCSDQDVVGKDEMRVRTDELGVRVTTDTATFRKGDGPRGHLAGPPEPLVLIR